jgi:hypothetical protein
VPGSTALLDALVTDPLALYPALAALLLASVSLATGLLRGDPLALARPLPVLWLLLALGGTFGLAQLTPVVPAQYADVVLGLMRLPLYLFALAYGAVPGLIAAALAAAYLGLPHGDAWGPWLLGLEVVVIGWLAVWPSPRVSRWAGPVDGVLAYALAWGTAGISALALRDGAVTLAGLQAQHGLVPVGVLASALLLSGVSPATYRVAFPGSRIVPPEAVRTSTDTAGRVPTLQWERERAVTRRRALDPTLTATMPPPPLTREPRRRGPLGPPRLGRDAD